MRSQHENTKETKVAAATAAATARRKGVHWQETTELKAAEGPPATPVFCRRARIYVAYARSYVAYARI